MYIAAERTGTRAKKPILITPIGNLGGAAKKTVKITLTPEPACTAGTPGAVKVKILGDE